jgi:DNA-binding IclR family transcriptional regulator
MLRAVLLQPGMLQSQLAKELVIQRPTATRVLDGLQNLGLVERRPTSNDGRGRVQPGGRRHQQHAYHARLIFFYLTSCIPN